MKLRGVALLAQFLIIESSIVRHNELEPIRTDYEKNVPVQNMAVLRAGLMKTCDLYFFFLFFYKA